MSLHNSLDSNILIEYIRTDNENKIVFINPYLMDYVNALKYDLTDYLNPMVKTLFFDISMETLRESLLEIFTTYSPKPTSNPVLRTFLGISHKIDTLIRPFILE